MRVGDADWAQIAAVKRAVGIPVIANGNVSTFEVGPFWLFRSLFFCSCAAQDAQACLAATGCDAVMSAWGLLRDPGLFAGPGGGGERSLAAEAAAAAEWAVWAAGYAGRGASVKRTKLHLFKVFVLFVCFFVLCRVC